MTAAPTPTETADRALREAPYVLMKRGLYWCPNDQGYTGVLAEAGRYSEADARARSNDGSSMHLAAEAAEFSPACWPETKIAVHEATIAALRAEVSRLHEVVRIIATGQAFNSREYARVRLTKEAQGAYESAAQERGHADK